LFHEPESNINFYDFDSEYYKLLNAERFINNEQAIVDTQVETNSAFKELLDNNPNLEMLPSPTDMVVNLNDEINESILNKKYMELRLLKNKIDFEVENYGYSTEVQQEDFKLALGNNNTSEDNSTKYSELIRGITDGKDIVVYSQEENGSIFKE
jgi:hypothetical protein